jgi:hypothetical protein
MRLSKRTPGAGADKTALSLGVSKTVRGVEVKKMPIGAYLKALKKLETLPGDFLNACFPGKTAQEVIDIFSGIDGGGLVNLVPALLTAAPKFVLDFAGELLDVGAERLENDPEIGLVGLVEILSAFVEVNELGELGAAISRLTNSVKSLKTTPATGSKA